MSNFIGPPPPSGGAGAGAAAGGGMSYASVAIEAMRAAMGAIGGYYAAQLQKGELSGQARNLRFEGSMGDQNARSAEIAAEQVLEAAQRDIGLRTLQAGQVQGAARASMAASGVQAGVGNAAEVMASLDLAKKVDVFTINSNAVRQAGGLRVQAQDQRNRANLARTSAANLDRQRRAINPYAAAAGSLLGTASTLSFGSF